MGSTVSVDGHDSLETAIGEGIAASGPLRSTAHLLAWRFSRPVSGSVVEESIFPLVDQPPVLDARAVFVVLHVFQETVSTWPFVSVSATVEDMFTPRGLKTDMSSCGVDDWLRDAHESTRFSIFTCNGREADCQAKAAALSRALSLNQRIRKNRLVLGRLLQLAPVAVKRATHLKINLATAQLSSGADALPPDIKAYRGVLSEIVKKKNIH